MSTTGTFVVGAEVAEALARGAPVVALETTLVTHGFPPPEGLAVASEMESEIRAQGAVPATIGVLDGRARVGLSRAELERLAGHPTPAKLNLGNLAAQIASGGPGSTTVAATVLLASHAGIRVFATGGIGGVHRWAVESGDVSADLLAIARHCVAVVSSGAKAVLDLPRTVEALETLGVPVYGFGTDDFPAFYRRASGLAVDRRFDDPRTLATAVRTHFDLGVGTGVVVANPVPVEHEMPAALYEDALRDALEAAAHASVRGRDVTPFLLARMAERTGGASRVTNRALLRNNARLAALLAREIGRAHD